MCATMAMTVHCKVRGQGRPKFGRGHAYEKREDTAYKEMLRAEWVKQTGGYSFGSVPLAVSIIVERQLPKSRPKRVVGEDDVYKPDVDNIAKAVLDALQGVAFEDDRQVVGLSISKWERKRHDDGMDVLKVAIYAA